MANDTNNRRLQAIILAAGKGTRMKSDLAKVMHPVADKPMVHWVIKACQNAGAESQVIVIGHQADVVRNELAQIPNLVFAEQLEQNGTGHAVIITEEAFENNTNDLDIFVLCGDGPLIRTDTLNQLLTTHRESNASATLATAILDEPTGYGRIVRTPQGTFERIVEQKDATPDELNIQEVNPSYYCFKADALFQALKEINNDNANGEYYLTDVLGIMINQGQTVMVVDAVPAEDVLSINTLEHLQTVDQIMRNRLGMEAVK